MKTILEAINAKTEKPAVAAAPAEEEYYGPRCADGTKPDLNRALKDFSYYRANRDAVKALREVERLAVQRAAEDERLAKRKAQVLENRARAEATRQVEEAERQRLADERQAEIEERVRAMREATS
jgi:hypothetical protein